MSTVTELWVNRENYRETKIMGSASRTLADAEIRVRIEKFGLTSNNVSYAVSGDMIGYWKYYPADEPWGKVPVWGIAEVVESKASEMAVGEHLYGFFPMASETVLTVGSTKADAFIDASPHRQDLPALYNQYRRTKADPAYLQSMETERCLLFPLFITSYVLYDYLVDSDYFGAEQVVIGSVSSKTGFGLAELLKQDGKKRVVGLTSPAKLPSAIRNGDLVSYSKRPMPRRPRLPERYQARCRSRRLQGLRRPPISGQPCSIIRCRRSAASLSQSQAMAENDPMTSTNGNRFAI